MSIEIRAGVQEWHALSPYLFNCFIARVIGGALQGYSVIQVSDIYYADDIMILSKAALNQRTTTPSACVSI